MSDEREMASAEAHRETMLDEALAQSFPASDPVPAQQFGAPSACGDDRGLWR
jgi:hypothetical protein